MAKIGCGGLFDCILIKNNLAYKSNELDSLTYE